MYLIKLKFIGGYSNIQNKSKLVEALTNNTKVPWLLRSSQKLFAFEDSSQKFSEYTKWGCLKEAQTIQNTILGAAKRPQQRILLRLASLRQPFCIYSENF